MSVNQWISLPTVGGEGGGGERRINIPRLWLDRQGQRSSPEISAGASLIARDGSCPKGLLLESQTDFLVGIIITSVRKIFGTSWTLEWPLTGMDSLMCLE